MQNSRPKKIPYVKCFATFLPRFLVHWLSVKLSSFSLKYCSQFFWDLPFLRCLVQWTAVSLYWASSDAHLMNWKEPIRKFSQRIGNALHGAFSHMNGHKNVFQTAHNFITCNNENRYAKVLRWMCNMRM
jgi:hypothetical protein